jgi:glutamine cyclotransferase
MEGPLVYLRKSWIVFALLAVVACSDCAAAPVEGYKVVATYPHSTSSYTEGFFYLDGLF